jgi:DNA-binding sugar fermentation-stimulating protein
MEIEQLSDGNKDEWNDFCLYSNDAWFRHTTYWMDYIMCCRFDSNSKNHSFLVRQNKEIVAVVPLISQYCYEDRTINEFANYDTPTPYWALKNDNENINKVELVKFISSKIEDIALVDGVRRKRLFIDPLIDSNYFYEFENYNLLKYNYKCKVNTTNVIDLTFSETVLLNNMRKGHKSDIKRAIKDEDIQVECVNKSSNKIDVLFSEYKKMHIIDVGRQTRTDASWGCMLNWIYSGYGILILARSKSKQEYISGAFVLIYKHSAYYGSYATIDSISHNAIVGHLIQWNIIKYLKEMGIKKYETGWNYYKSSPDAVHDEKLLRISRFKAGFGGKEKVFFEFTTP